MAKVFLTGATGILGRALVPRLVAAGHAVEALSRREQAGTDVDWLRGDLRKGRAIGAAWRADCVIHAATQHGGRMDELHVRATAALQAAMRPEGHIIYPSLVGCDAHPLGYHQSKWRGEQAVEGGDRPWTIVRGTHTHELLWAWLNGHAATHLGKGYEWQPVAAGELADRIVRAVREGPAGRVEFGGPELLQTEDIIETFETFTGRRGPRMLLPHLGPSARAFRQGVHCTPHHAHGTQTWREFLEEHATDAAH